MGQLDGKVIFVAGGSGNVGEGVVSVFLKKGATVIVPSRRQEALDKLGEYLGDLATDKYVPMVGNIGTLDGAEKLRDEILAKFGHLDGVLVSLGGWWTGNKPLTEVDMETWERYLNSNLTAHFLCAKTFLPVLAETEGSSYTLLGGTAAELPLPNVSPVGITAAGQLMMAKIVMEEMKDSGIRINEVIIQGMVKTRVMEAYSQPNWITPTEIGEFTSWLASDEAYMITNSVLHINQRAEKAS